MDVFNGYWMAVFTNSLSRLESEHVNSGPEALIMGATRRSKERPNWSKALTLP